MKKRIFILSLVLVLLISVPVQAAARDVGNKPTLTISGTTASCSVKVYGINAKDSISVTMKLWDGNECIRTWTGSGTVLVSLSKTATVTKGHSYTLTVDAVIAGVSQPRTSAYGTCR